MKFPIAAAVCAVSSAVFAQAAPQPVPGVRHRLEVSMSVDPQAPAIRENRERPRADLKLRIRVSDHAIDSDYFGIVAYDFASADPVNDKTVKTVWEDPRCHIDRGLPKFSILDIRGSLTGPDTKLDIAALPRHIGKHVPDDEIVARLTQQSQQRGPGQQPGISLRAQTKRSGIAVSIDLIATRCTP